MVTDRVGPTITTLKAEVDFLSDELRQAKAENKQLLEENSSLSTWQCVYTDGKTGLAGDEHGNQYCAMAKENERLRAALEQLLACPAIADGNHNDPAWACHETAAAETFARKVLARAALEGK